MMPFPANSKNIRIQKRRRQRVREKETKTEMRKWVRDTHTEVEEGAEIGEKDRERETKGKSLGVIEISTDT